MRPLWFGFLYNTSLFRLHFWGWLFTFYKQEYKEKKQGMEMVTSWDITIRLLGLTIIIRR
jgi:hypothetical protein